MSQHNKEDAAPKIGAPKWASEPFERYFKETETLFDLLRLSQTGISLLRGIPKTIEVLAKYSDEVDPSNEERLEVAKREAKLAQKEIDEGFPLLHNQALITAWTLLESTVKSYVINWIRYNPDAIKIDSIGKIKIELGDYLQLNEDDRPQYIFEIFEREIGRAEPMGFKRFEKILAPFGMSGPVSEQISQDLYTTANLRNALVHRSAVVDYQLLRKCPYLEMKVGDQIKVSPKQLRTLSNSMHSYVILLICRSGELFGVDMSKERDSVLNNDFFKFSDAKTA